MPVATAEKTRLSLGFIALTDCAPLAVARELGFFDQAGLDVSLVKEASWGNIRDKVSYGLLDGAQMLAPMPLAATLGLGTRAVAMITGLVLSYNGLAVTLSQALFDQLDLDPQTVQTPEQIGQLLRQYCQHNREHGDAKPRLATVYPYSCHFYQLHQWLLAHSIVPGEDIELVALPPTRMLSTLKAGEIDGYCVGEPWNSLAEQQQLGRVIVSGHQIAPDAIEKVFGVTQQWATEHPITHQRLLSALSQACQWLDKPENQPELQQLLLHPDYLGPHAPAKNLQPHQPVLHKFWHQQNIPHPASAVELLEQMRARGQWQGENLLQVAEAVYRPELAPN